MGSFFCLLMVFIVGWSQAVAPTRSVSERFGLDKHGPRRQVLLARRRYVRYSLAPFRGQNRWLGELSTNFSAVALSFSGGVAGVHRTRGAFSELSSSHHQI